MDRKALLEHLLKTFLLELDEHLAALSRGLLQLEAGVAGDERAATLEALFRAAHSLKGAARAVDQPLIADLCHAMEATLAELRRGAIEASPALFQLLFGCVDALDEAAKAGGPAALERGQLEALTADLIAAARGEPIQTRPSPPEPVPDAQPSLPPTDARTRVPLGRLDALLAKTGELMVARRRVRHDAEEVRDLAEALTATRQAQWVVDARVRATLQELGAEHPGAAECVALLERARASMVRAERSLDALAQKLRVDVHQLERVAEPFEQQVRQLRMLPFRELEPLLERAARDAGHVVGKRVRLELLGQDVEADRAVLEGLKDALVHLVRNAVVHGIEAPEARAAAGKPPEGLVRVQARLKGPNVEISVHDDGGGIGLDIGLNQVEALHGSVEIVSDVAVGSRFSMLLPLTLTSLRALLVEAAGTPFAVASSNVVRLLRVSAEDVCSVEGREMLSVDEELIPLLELSRVLGIDDDGQRSLPARRPVVVMAGGERKMAFAVDELVSEREVVVKGLGARLPRVRHVAGGTLMDSGQVALLLNAAELVRTARGLVGQASARFADAVTSSRGLVLVADDSLTTRSLMKSVLIAAGYQVVSAQDGLDAWQQLQQAPVELVVADVEMPRMTGIGLTEKIRASARWRELPVVLVTGLGGEADRARGLAAGANAYIVKGGFDQRELLAVLEALVSA